MESKPLKADKDENLEANTNKVQHVGAVSGGKDNVDSMFSNLM